MLLQWCCWSSLILMGFKTIWGASVVLYLPYKSIFFPFHKCKVMCPTCLCTVMLLACEHDPLPNVNFCFKNVSICEFLCQFQFLCFSDPPCLGYYLLFFFGSLLHCLQLTLLPLDLLLSHGIPMIYLQTQELSRYLLTGFSIVFLVGLSSLLQMCTAGYRINVLFFWSRSVIVWLLWRLFHIGGLIESICQRQPLLTTKGTRFPHVC